MPLLYISALHCELQRVDCVGRRLNEIMGKCVNLLSELNWLLILLDSLNYCFLWIQPSWSTVVAHLLEACSFAKTKSKAHWQHTLTNKRCSIFENIKRLSNRMTFYINLFFILCIFTRGPLYSFASHNIYNIFSFPPNSITKQRAL